MPQTGNYGPMTRAALEKALRGEKPPKTDPAPTPTPGSGGKVTKPPVVSAHYRVDRDGTIYQLVSDERAAWHAGVAHLHGDRNAGRSGPSVST